MKINPITRAGYALLVLITMMVSACKKDDTGPSIDDQVLNYEINVEKPTKNYTVGAFYRNTGSGFNANIKEIPTVGKYGFPVSVPVLLPATNPAVSVMPQHIDQAKKAKIDYLIFALRSPNLENTGFRSDSIGLNAFINAPNASEMKFAVSYSLSTAAIGLSNTVPLENRPAAVIENFYRDFTRLAVYFKMNNYMKLNGKPVLLINNAQDLNSKDNPALYREIRRRLSLLGIELYIIGMQDRWSPPQRYYYRFQNCVDGMYENNMIDTRDYDRYYLFLQNVDQGWKYWKSMVESWGVEFIPSISPAFSQQIQTPTSLFPSFIRNDGGLFFRKFSTVARNNSSASGMILIDSFNDWRVDTQIESAQSYGDTYLNITREEFKLP